MITKQVKLAFHAIICTNYRVRALVLCWLGESDVWRLAVECRGGGGVDKALLRR